MRPLIFYLAAVNLFAFALMGIDKSKARRGKWRVPEKTLFFTAIIGGSPGAIAGMLAFRHKTKHKAFTLGMPLIALVQLLVAYFLYF